MWGIFKIINILWLLASTHVWVFNFIPMNLLLVLANILMIFCMGMLPIKIELTKKTGMVFFIIVSLMVWESWCEGINLGVYTFLSYLPALYLIHLPLHYLKDLLEFTTKWYAILLIPALIVYWLTLFTGVPSIGSFDHPNYPPFINHIFYIETTYDYGTFVRFNAFFLEPGHQALLSTFLLFANRYRFKERPLLWVLVVAILFSFSLAGYILSFIGYAFLKIDSILKGLAFVAVSVAVVIGFQTYAGVDNSVNQLILERLERDNNQGIKGNNRFSENTDKIYKECVKNGDVWHGVSDKVNMNLVTGAGYKVYVLHYGIIGALLALLLYIALIPPQPAIRFTVSFLILFVLCFVQRSYPGWYAWLFPYVAGIYVAKYEKEMISTETAV